MSILMGLTARVRDLFGRRRSEARMNDEFRFHLEMETEQNLRRGLLPEEARRAALVAFGGVDTHREAMRDGRGARWLMDLWRDLGYAARGLRRSPGFTTVVVLTLALGLGVNVAIFSLLDRLFVQPPAGVAAPEQVHRLYVTTTWAPERTMRRGTFNYPEVRDLMAAAAPFAPLAVYDVDSVSVGGAGGSVTAAEYTNADYWTVLGVRPRLGRTYTAAEARIEAPSNVVVVSDAFWRRQLGARSGVLGTAIRLGDYSYTIIGVAPPGFAGPDVSAVDLWFPLGDMPMPEWRTAAWYQIRSSSQLNVLMRQPSAVPEPVLAARFTRAFRAGLEADDRPLDTVAVVSTGPIIAALGPLDPKAEVVISTRLIWVSLLVLLIACANVANLLLARMVERRSEVALRVALGASRLRLTMQVLAECALLALLAGIVALGVGAWAASVLRVLLLPAVHWSSGPMEWPVALATAGGALVVTCAAGIAPILQSRAIGGGETVSARAGRTVSAGRTRAALVVLEIALTVVLLAGAGLFIQSLRKLANVGLGYDVDRIVMAAPAALNARGGEDTKRSGELSADLNVVAQRMANAPDVESVALADHGPMDGYLTASTTLANGDTLPRVNGQVAAVAMVSPEYWRTVGLRLIRGRLLDARDRAGTALTVVINETMARAVWPGRDPIGQCLVFGNDCRTVVGVVRDAHRIRIDESAEMQYYVPLAQATTTGTAASARAIIVRTDGTPGASARVAAQLRTMIGETIHNVEPRVVDIRQLMAPQLHPWRLGAALFTALGALALVVAAVGLYGVIAYDVRSRTHELGVRIALGADRRRVLRLVIGGGLTLAAVGLGAGVMGALVAGRLVASLLYGTSTHDPSVLIGVVVTMLTTTVVASLVPAWRAARVDPLVALRAE